MSKTFDSENLIQNFGKLLKNKEDCKLALENPAKMFQKNGIPVTDPKLFNKTVFQYTPSIKDHLLAGSEGDDHEEGLSSCKSAGCISCEGGLNAALATVIVAAIAGCPEDVPEIAEIAKFCDLSVAAVKTIITAASTTGATGVEVVINELCSLMGAC